MVVCGCSLRQKLPPEPQRNLTCPLLGGKTWKLARALFHHFYKGHIYHYLVESVQKIRDAVAKHDNQVEENICESEVSDTKDCDTAKSLSRGKFIYQVIIFPNVKENIQGTF